MNKLFLMFWVTLAYTVCLMPGPGYWEERLCAEDGQQVGRALRSAPSVEKENHEQSTTDQELETTRGELSRTNNQSLVAAKNECYSLVTEDLGVKERLGHFIPMVGIAFCFVRLPRSRKIRTLNRILLTLLFSASIAFSIELLQECLPECFSRGFAWNDIGFGLTGGAVGALLGVFTSPRVRVGSEG